MPEIRTDRVRALLLLACEVNDIALEPIGSPASDTGMIEPVANLEDPVA